ncbi:MAG TPA: hypothetical protein QGG93_12000 [Verrucomicrobiota bacterium]|nr:hypothetical protein [Verrucomicrobiota bacterium]|tara:strand:- start:303 stop:743 length:441 start_codon:yes stop_codon:yes gene_type:complete
MNSTVATFYQFVDLPDFETKRAPLKAECERHSAVGTVILRHEGINDTIAGPSAGMQPVLEDIRSNERLVKAPARLCFGCRWPLTDEEMESPQHERGVNCPHCADELTPERRTRLRERHQQMSLAHRQGAQHIGQQPKREAQPASDD